MNQSLSDTFIITTMIKKKGNRYSTEQMIVVLKIYQETNFNASETHKRTKVSRVAIKKWAEKLGVQVFAKNHVQEVVHKVNVAIATRKERVADKLNQAKEDLLDRLIERIPHTIDLHSISNALKIIHEIEKVADDPDKESTGDSISYIETVTRQLTIKP